MERLAKVVESVDASWTQIQLGESWQTWLSSELEQEVHNGDNSTRTEKVSQHVLQHTGQGLIRSRDMASHSNKKLPQPSEGSTFA